MRRPAKNLRRNRVQPYKRGGAGRPGAAKTAMTRGRTLYGHNPMDRKRRIQRKRKNPLYRYFPKAR